VRIGHGYDVHAFCEGDSIVLCGVQLPHNKGFRAHSDGDVALHALCDALLGAAGLGDIGRHFPDTDPAYSGIDSRLLLRNVVAQLAQRNWLCNNCDVTIIAEAPKIAPHIEPMVMCIAEDLGVSASCVNVKATTSEKLGFTGRAEGIAAHAVVTITEKQ